MLTHGDIGECIGATMSVNCIEVWSSGVHTSDHQIGSYVALIPVTL